MRLIDGLLVVACSVTLSVDGIGVSITGLVADVIVFFRDRGAAAIVCRLRDRDRFWHRDEDRLGERDRMWHWYRMWYRHRL